MKKFKLILYSVLDLSYSIISLFFFSTPKPHYFCGLQLSSSLGGFNLGYLLSAQQLLDILGNILPYVLPMYLPLRHFITEGMRLPSIGYSLDTTEDILGSDITDSALSILPNRPILIHPLFRLYMNALYYINTPSSNLVLIGLFVLCLRHVGLLSVRNNFFSVISIFMFFPRGVLGYSLIRNVVLDRNGRLIIYTLSTNILFGIFNFFFDYLSLLYRLRSHIFFNNIYITYFILGFAYLLNITFGVFGSNGTWYWGQYNNLNTGWTVILSTLLSIILPSFWFIAGSRNVNPRWDISTSIFRSILEVFAFNSVAFCTYIYWGFWISHVTYYTNLIAVIVFTILYVFVSYITIYFETFGGRPLIYGISYWVMFTCAAMLSNGIFALINQSIIPFYIRIIIIVALSLTTIIIYPNIYRGGIIMTRSVLADAILSNNNLLNQETGHMVHLIFWHLFIYLLLFNNFVIHTGFFFPYVAIWFNLI